MPLKLGLDPELLSIAPSAETQFSLTAILDQETPGGGPFTGSYRLWLTNANDFSAVPEPGTIVLAVTGWTADVPGRAKAPTAAESSTTEQRAIMKCDATVSRWSNSWW